MKDTSSKINQELRARGIGFHRINPTFTESRLRLLHKITRKIHFAQRDPRLSIRRIWIPRSDGSIMRMLIFSPRNFQGEVPGVLWFHGGGYAIGSPEQSLGFARILTQSAPCVVVSPDYRLSPESPYPAALDDAYTALVWMKNHALEMGIRSNQIMVGGDSAGGGLAAALCLYARDESEIQIAFQMPLYPMLDDRMTTPSAQNNNAPIWNSESNYNSWKLYLGDLFGSEDVPYYAAPARAVDHTRLPPAATFVGELEPFRDETVEYVKNLTDAGIPVQFRLFPGCYHAFDQICPHAAVSREAASFLANAFQYAVNHYFAEQL